MLDVAFHASGSRVALVTGAAGGIGGAVVDAFLAAGVSVVAADLKLPPERSASTGAPSLDRRAADAAAIHRRAPAPIPHRLCRR